MSRLEKRNKPQDAVRDNLIKKKDESVRINIMVKKSDLDWLDKAVDDFNQKSARNINRSEVIRLLLRQLKEEGLEKLYSQGVELG